MKRRIEFIFLIIFQVILLQAQEMLTIEDAIRIGLEKNYDVLVSRNGLDIAKAQNNIGNAGMSPSVSLNGNFNLSNANSHQEFSSGTVQDKTGAASSNLGASANVSWMLFDGMKMFAVKKRLAQNEQLNAIELKQQIENMVYAIILSYYDVVRSLEMIKAQEQNLAVYSERKNIASEKLLIGSQSKVDLMMTQTDENKAKADLLQLQLQLTNAKVKLNTLLVRPADVDFKTEETIRTNYEPSMEELKRSSEKNTSFMLSKQNELIVAQTINEARAANLPFVQFNGAYNFSRFESQAGFVFLNKQNGITAGISAGWLIFNGNKNAKLVKERQINLLSQQYITQQTKLNVDALVYVNFQNYLTNKQILELEKKNLTDSKELLDVSLERYKIGKSNLLETKEAQRNLEDAQVRYVNALYNVKKAETELLKANGSLVK